MLTEAQYKELLRYRGGGVEYNGELTEPLSFLLRKKYAILYHPATSDGKISNASICVITEIGKDALAEYERADDVMRKEKASKDADKSGDRKFQTKQTLLNAVVCAVVSVLFGLVVGHFSEIVSFFTELFQKLPSP